MNEKLMGAKAAVAAFFAGLGTLLGWKGVMVIIWMIAMALDYLSGTCAAAKNGQWSSTTARQGLWHKGGMILVVLVALIADVLFQYFMPRIPVLEISNPGALLPLVLAWYVITEIGSILENAIKLGAKVPKWFDKILKAGLAAVDQAGQHVTGGDGDGGDGGTAA